MIDDFIVRVHGRSVTFPRTLQVVYSRSSTLFSVAIRAASWWDRWSHCGIVTPENTVIEARAFHGVVETPWREFFERVSALEIVDVHCPSPAAALDWARGEIGAGYDWGAVASIVLREPLDGRARRHCAELVEMALARGGSQRFRKPLHLVKPSESFNVL